MVILIQPIILLSRLIKWLDHGVTVTMDVMSLLRLVTM